MKQGETRRFVAVILTATILGLLVSCATTATGPTDRPLYHGYGIGSSMTGALNEAKRYILTVVVPDLVGTAAVAASRDTLETKLHSGDALNAYFYLDSMEIISQGRDGDDHSYRIAIRVNLDALARSLRSLGVYGGQVTPSANARLALPDVASPQAVSATQAPQSVDAERGSTGASPSESDRAPSSRESPASSAGLSDEEQAVIDGYLQTLTYLVYFDEDVFEDPFVVKSAIGMANGYLADTGRAVVDLDRVERMKKDQELAYEERTGRSVGLIQWIAQSVNADVYAELDARTVSEREGKRYYGQANLTMKFFEASTGALLSAVNYKSPRTFSQSSELDAVNNALQSSVYESMPVAVEQLETVLRNSASTGIPYRLVLQNTGNARIIREFARKLEAWVEAVETESQSQEETVFRVSFLGMADDLMDVVFDVADRIPAFASIELVLLTGRNLTFDTGM